MIDGIHFLCAQYIKYNFNHVAERSLARPDGPKSNRENMRYPTIIIPHLAALGWVWSLLLASCMYYYYFL